jgi:hypothetical protein
MFPPLKLCGVPAWGTGQLSAARIGFGGFFELFLPPVSETQILIQPPFSGVIADAKFDEVDGFVGVFVLQEEPAEAKCCDVVRVEFRHQRQHWFQQVQTADIKNFVCLFLPLEVFAEIDCCANPVNVGE